MPPANIKHFYVVPKATSLRIRKTPSFSAATLGQVAHGDRVDIDLSQAEVQAGDWIWHPYQGGFLPERRVDETSYTLFSEADLPALDSLFEAMPTPLDQLSHFYYYGNTNFAFCCGHQNNYQGYSQELHGGLDFGHPGGLVIHAGISGRFVSTTQKTFSPNLTTIHTEHGYDILYGHIANPRPFQAKADIHPDTEIGDVSVNRKHLHLEIRYRGFIINPLLLMSQVQRDAIFNTFAAVGAHGFYNGEGWTRWQTPLDQPIIRRDTHLYLQGPRRGRDDAQIAPLAPCPQMGC